ncbi:GntR family transcriptional regulator [Gluconacetobacter sacchari]|uniref:GntR family transcriptional regulator n=1 Tax=Gluconacetobacter sacchari TaxID=92759 RepID=UPI0022321C3F|nr:GntR family transcriptional regulator [Gluconacetobacter sacchari]
MNGTIKPVERSTIQEQIYTDLRHRIMCGFFFPGHLFKLMEVAAAYGSSAMPVREALSRLVAERALENAPNRSIVVPVLSEDRLEDLRRVRKTVEGFAIRAAFDHLTAPDLDEIRALLAYQVSLEGTGNIPEAVEANARFHFQLYRLSRSVVLMPIIESLWLQFGPYLGHATALNDLNPGRGLVHHHAMLAALGRRDLDATIAAFEKDVDISFDLLAANPPPGRKKVAE